MSSEAPRYRPLDAETTREMLRDFRGERTGWVQVGEKRWLFPHRYTEQGEGFFKFKARPDDTWVLSFPRSGTTWTQELVWLVANDLDFDAAKSRLLPERFPFLEYSMYHHPELTKEFLEYNEADPGKCEFVKELAKPGYEVLESAPSPRFIKSHFPFSLLPNLLGSGCKVVYVARNPKDVVVSWYKLNQAMKTQGYVRDFAKFWNYFKNDLTAWSPYWEHLKEAWALRDHKNLLFLFYEDLKENLPEVIARVGKFFGKTYSNEEISKLADHLDIKNFRNNPMINSHELKECGIMYESADFIRKGQSGGWGDYFTKELEADANEWIAKHLKELSIQFPCANNNWM